MRDRPPNLLESWKEIGVFIGRDERTAMRWAKNNGMPVHRVPGGTRGHVFAYTEEILAWLNNRTERETGPQETASIATVPVPTEAPVSPSTVGGESRRMGHRWLWLAAGLAVMLAAWASSRLSARGSFRQSLRIAGVTKLTDDSRPKMFVRTDGRTLYFTETLGMHHLLMSMPAAGGKPQSIATPLDNVNLQDISSDGQRLLVTSFQGMEIDRPLWELPLDGGPPRRIGDILCNVARWSPDGQRIAFIKDNQLWIAMSDGSKVSRLSSFENYVQDFSWMPQGDRLRIKVEQTLDMRSSIWDVPLPRDTETYPVAPWRLVESKEEYTTWAWIDHGSYFAIADQNLPAQSELILTPDIPNPWLKKNDLERLPLTIGKVSEMTASPLGRDLYMVVSGEEHGEVMRYDAHSDAFRVVLPGISALHVAFSRDGEWISFIDTETRSLWRSRLDGSDLLRITSPPVRAELSAWSPDGKRIAFMARSPGKMFHIYTTNRDGTDLQEAPLEGFQQGGPSWSPDGKYIVYGKVNCLDTNTCELRRVELAAQKDEPIEGSQGLRTARWSYDGKYIAALEPKRHELMLMNVATGRWKLLGDHVTGDDISWSHNSEYVYFNCPAGEKPAIERIRVRDGKRETGVSLAAFQKLSGSLAGWFSLAPDDSPIVTRYINPSEIYAIHLAQ